MKIKSGVRLTGLTPQMALGCHVVDSTFKRLVPGYEPTVTSINDGKHGDKSKHYDGNGVDWRTKDYPGNKHQLRDEVKKDLGDDFDVVLEAEGQDNEHLHTEYDPK